MSFIYNMSDTWNDVGTTFNAILMNISNGAAGAPVGSGSSNFINLQSNGTSLFRVNILGLSIFRSLGTQILDMQNAASTAGPKITANVDATNSNFQFYNAVPTTKAISIGLNAPSGAFTDDGIMGCYNGTIWVEIARWLNAGGFKVGTAAIATTATDGFLHIPTCAGAPTGVPNLTTGLVPMIFDTTNSQFWFYTGGAWKQPKTPAAAALITWQ